MDSGLIVISKELPRTPTESTAPHPIPQAIKYHPDKNPDGVEMFQKLQNAYDILSDEDQRKQYAQLLAMQRAKAARCVRGGWGEVVVGHATPSGAGFAGV